MADMMTSISTAIATAKKLTDLSKKIENVEFNHLLADLNLELAETKNRLSGIVMENTNLKEQVHALESRQGKSGQFIDYKGASFKRLTSGGFEESVYCSECKAGMATIDDDDPFACGKCGGFSGFNSGKLKDVLLEVHKEFG